MRKLIVSEFVTLDGIMEAPEKWSFQFWNEEAAKYKYDELFASDALLLGRLTYQIFAASWPSMTDQDTLKMIEKGGGDTERLRANIGRENPFADRMNSIQKFVVSTTLKEVGWSNSRLLNGNVAEEVSKLKLQSGKDILINGSAELTRTLMQHDLIDEYRLMIFPIVLGSGKRLFREDADKKVLKLVDSKTFSSGVVVLTYQPLKKVKK